MKKLWGVFLILVAFLAACRPAPASPTATTPPMVEPPPPAAPDIIPPTATPSPPPPPTPVPAETVYEWFEESPAPEKFSLVRIGRTDAELTDILRAEAHIAASLGRHPYVEFSADWCPPCRALRAGISDARMIEAFEGTYIITLDIDFWKEKLAGTGFDITAIPIFLEIDLDGFPTGRAITGAAWGADIPANMAPPLKAFFDEGRAD